MTAGHDDLELAPDGRVGVALVDREDVDHCDKVVEAADRHVEDDLDARDTEHRLGLPQRVSAGRIDPVPELGLFEDPGCYRVTPIHQTSETEKKPTSDEKQARERIVAGGFADTVDRGGPVSIRREP